MEKTIFDYISEFKDPIMWRYIVIHHSLTRDRNVVDWNAIDMYHRSLGWDMIGYHSGLEQVDNKYKFQIGRPLDKQGAHTRGMNDKALGICIVGNYDYHEPEEAQYFMIASLCRAYMIRFGIPIQNVLPHWAYAVKTCPGRMFSMLRLRDYIVGDI